MVVERTVAELNGVSCLALEGVAPDKQQIIASRSFGELVTDLVGIAPRRPCCGEATLAAQRRADSRGQLRTNPFSEGDGQYKGWIVVLLVHPSCDSITITSAALAGLRTIFRPGYAYKKAGVMLMEIGPVGIDQQDLFTPLPDPKRAAVMAVMDKVNREYGRGTLRLASEGVQQGWAMRQERRSPRWTTCWDELPVVR